MAILSSGAEAIIYKETSDRIVKDRIEKSYRIPDIDIPLRTHRTKKELKVIAELHKIGVPVPKVVGKTNTTIEMEFIDGTQLKKLLDNHPEYSEMMGKNLTLMHDAGIIHGDLTTSNMILKDNELFFIDFGLSFYSKKIEDKAVDIHLFKQALESKHFRVFDEAYNHFLKGYTPKDKKEIMQRLHIVEQRGRYKEKSN